MRRKRGIERQIANGKESKTAINLQSISNDTKRKKNYHFTIKILNLS